MGLRAQANPRCGRCAGLRIDLRQAGTHESVTGEPTAETSPSASVHAKLRRYLLPTAPVGMIQDASFTVASVIARFEMTGEVVVEKAVVDDGIGACGQLGRANTASNGVFN